MREREVIQEIFLKANYNMKFHIKGKMCKIAYLESTDMKPLTVPIKTKDTLEKVKSILGKNSTKRSPSYLEHVTCFIRTLQFHNPKTLY